MAHKGSLEALDKTLKDIKGCVSLLYGDFRQTLPIIPKGTRADAVITCIKLSSLWQDVTILILTANMRAQLFGDNLSGDFSKQLLNVGDGTTPADAAGEMIVSHVDTPVDTVDDLAIAVFPDLHIRYQNLNWLCERAILAPKITFVAKLNENLLRSLPRNLHTCKYVDTVVDEE
ncbi:uncharacterized protein LOC106869950 [Octopus bimaculoides]|uniref:uncharacterized protein LOC106869950 n=1 Tax=Octopus bimaculoides TaxID=37653 RepID=UPI00071D99F0|nr:uncharacterized protein LOC106869950 [Octopus bimaculoides]|eukprot:XP_014771379.1 PREDICTED: uncharacterized protein LOC106869950 [Octopus bimaculoides]